MNKITAFFRLVRFTNLLFIGLSQWMFYYCIINPVYSSSGLLPSIHGEYLYYLMLSYMLIGAGGNIINDYFDLNIDLINKPEKVIIEKHVSRRWAIIHHLGSSLASILLGIFISFHTSSKYLWIANCVCIFLSFIYSLSLKKKLLSGNVMMAFLLSWVILVTCFSELYTLGFSSIGWEKSQKIIRYTILYAGFSFIINLVREVVKDIEDMDGDSKFGCRTLPIVWGANAAKLFSGVWLFVLSAVIIILSFYAFLSKWYLFSIYAFVILALPMLFTLKQLKNATSKEDFHSISTTLKVIMLSGILSLFFFKMYG